MSAQPSESNREPAGLIRLADWVLEMERLGKLDCRFVCPACGNEASPNDWKAAGADIQRAPTECIGRLIHPDRRPLARPGQRGRPCDWAAFGLLDICTVHIELEDGKIVPVFAFASTESTP